VIITICYYDSGYGDLFRSSLSIIGTLIRGIFKFLLVLLKGGFDDFPFFRVFERFCDLREGRAGTKKFLCEKRQRTGYRSSYSIFPIFILNGVLIKTTPGFKKMKKGGSCRKWEKPRANNFVFVNALVHLDDKPPKVVSQLQKIIILLSFYSFW